MPLIMTYKTNLNRQIELSTCIVKLRGGYNGEPSIFDEMTTDDLIMAFFPCTRFEDQIKMWMQGNNYSQKKWTNKQKLEYDLIIHSELQELYTVITKMVILCEDKGLRLIIENPYSPQHYLTNYWGIKPSIIDKDRRQDGDYYEKPTQYWFINLEPKQNVLFEALEYVESKKVSTIKGGNRKTKRSMIHPQYANRFIRKYIL